MGQRGNMEFRPARAGLLSLDQWCSRGEKGFHPVRKRTFRLLLMRLKIAPRSLGERVAAGGFLK